MRRRVQRQRSGPPGQAAGFTLVELVVLIGIAGVIGAVAAPRFLAMDELAAAQARRRVLSDLRYAQRLATGSGCPIQIDFTASGYTLTRRTTCRTGPFALDVVDPLTSQAPFTVVLGPEVSLTSDVDPLVFDVLGRATDAGGSVSSASVTVGGWPIEVVGETGLTRVP